MTLIQSDAQNLEEKRVRDLLCARQLESLSLATKSELEIESKQSEDTAPLETPVGATLEQAVASSFDAATA